MTLEMIAFTGRGAALANRILDRLDTLEDPPWASACAPERHRTGRVDALGESLGEWTARRFIQGDALVFIGAAGIAVRAVAPHARGKDVDPAVLCVDEAGRYVIPLLSGHLGGANRMALQLAELIGAQAVLTTATDVNGVFAPDAWAAEHGCAVADISQIKHISAALLAGELVGLCGEFPVEGLLPAGLVPVEATRPANHPCGGAENPLYRCGIEIALRPKKPFEHTLHLIPRCIAAGIGCRRGVEAAVIEGRLREELAAHSLPIEAVGAVASVDIKAVEPGLRALAKTLRAPFVTYTAAELMAVPGAFTPSERVLAATGADNVCERAAVRACGPGATADRLIARKTGADGVTIALAQIPWMITF